MIKFFLWEFMRLLLVPPPLVLPLVLLLFEPLKVPLPSLSLPQDPYY